MVHANNTNYSSVSQLINRLGGVYRDPSRVSRDATTTLTSNIGQNLRPSIANLVGNDGVSSNVMLLKGTVPMVYRGGQYHVPIDIYFPPKYPVKPPVAFVRPVPTMMIKDGHRNVGSDGMVYMPYLHSWQGNSHNIVAMCTHMSNIFGKDPPLFARPAGQTEDNLARPSVTAQPPRYEHIQQEQARLTKLAEETRVANEAAEVARRAHREEQQNDAIKYQAKGQLKSKMQTRLRAFDNTCRRDIESLVKDQIMLEKSAKYVTGVSGDPKSGQMECLLSKKKELEEHHEKIDELTEKMNEYISKLEEQKDAAKEVDVDELVLPIDIYSGQMLALAAENAAISDALFFLDKGLVRGVIELDMHLKMVRKLARRQFLVKAQLLKVGQCKASNSFRNLDL